MWRTWWAKPEEAVDFVLQVTDPWLDGRNQFLNPKPFAQGVTLNPNHSGLREKESAIWGIFRRRLGAKRVVLRYLGGLNAT